LTEQLWPVEGQAVLVFDVLKKAIELHHCVQIVVSGTWRDVCPLALGYKDSRLRLLAFQYRGDSASGLGATGGWRCFFLSDISFARVNNDPWRSGDYSVWKLESSFDTVICGVGRRVPTFGRPRPR
jgi:predicted DNA-binding transcriptional regulator YafY